MKFEGPSWVFGDNINTDLMYPAEAFRASEEERCRLVFGANRPGWSSQVRPGEILVAGSNFGTGSGRPGSKYLKALGIAAIVAESINGLFLRNSVNYALPVMECKGIGQIVKEGERLSVDFDSGLVVNLTTGASRQAEVLPPMLREILESGGILKRLARDGFIDPDWDKTATSA